MKITKELVLLIITILISITSAWIIGNGPINTGNFKRIWKEYGDPQIKNNTVFTPWFYKWDIKDYYKKVNNKL